MHTENNAVTTTTARNNVDKQQRREVERSFIGEQNPSGKFQFYFYIII